MRALLGLVFFVVSVAAGAHAQADSYLCVAEKATGFKFDKATKAWEPSTFDVSPHKYIVARPKDFCVSRMATG